MGVISPEKSAKPIVLLLLKVKMMDRGAVV